MERFYTKTVGAPIYAEGARPITTVKDMMIDPASGKLAALEVNRGRNMVIVPMDIVSWQDVLRVHGQDSIIDADEVVKVSELHKEDVRIYRNRVEALDGSYLGRVYDFSIDSGSLGLQNLYVAKEILGMVRFGSRIIRARDIVEILKEKIIVKNNVEAVREKRDIVVEEMAKA